VASYPEVVVAGAVAHRLRSNNHWDLGPVEWGSTSVPEDALKVRGARVIQWAKPHGTARHT
jgi:hypothetical protein